ncbi:MULTISPECIES: ABC transporter substrate-binding protein [unclassified Bradyrhizobium]|uniref:ABC transporter substrate-binding protein n=1 Tax=unclassified Bradyrhizobium TaxID=2631580 RepID=UPI001FF8135C|nr:MULTISPECIES: ABC transporter substrate-binding protein [unclassified Bradyrhizobium]MCK1423002.1 ABC transporter substrate-binding protein [Bradyrhizobium sp. CW12]MCK1643769.1 ABC transporter substrate-binding protein [Bradyrhizobium sp. 154]
MRRIGALFSTTFLIGWALAGAAEAAEPLKVGFMTVRSGALAAGGRQMEEGLQLCVDAHKGEMAGRKIQIITADTAGQPAVTKTKAQELVERNGAQVLIGPLAAFEALAIDDYIRQTKTPIISPSAAAEDLTQRKPNPWFVRAVGTSAQAHHALGEYAAKELKYKRIVIIADDFAFGHELSAGFQRTFEQNGGKVIQKLWSPLNAAEYGTYITQIDPTADAVFAGFAGGNGIKFLGEYKNYGMQKPVLGAMTTVDEGILKRMGDEALGVISAGWYSAAIDTPANKKFVAAVQKAYNADPGYYTVGAYMACEFLNNALEQVKGEISDKAAFMKALRSVNMPESPYGQVKLDQYGQPILDITIRKVEKKDGKLQNTVIKTYPEVSQFWTYRPDEFLKSPVYSRDWTPAK